MTADDLKLIKTQSQLNTISAEQKKHDDLMASLPEIIKKFDEILMEVASREKGPNGWDMCEDLHHGYIPLINKIILDYESRGFKCKYIPKYKMINIFWDKDIQNGNP